MKTLLITISLFIAISFSLGLAVFILVLAAALSADDRPLGVYLVTKLGRLLSIFVAAVLYFVLVQHLTNLYATEHHGVERFILLEGGIYTGLFWIGQIIIGGFLPLFLLLHPRFNSKKFNVYFAAVCVIFGGLAQLYVIIIGGQAYPLVLFPGMEITSSFFDGAVRSYIPSLPEVLLGIGGISVAILITAIGLKALRFLPTSLEDSVTDPNVNKAP